MNKLLMCAILATAMVLGGCATAIRADDPVSEAVKGGEGTIVATLTNNTKQINVWGTMTVVRTADSQGTKLAKEENYTLNTRMDPGAVFTALYLGNVPTGTYRISQIEAHTTSGNLTWRHWVTFNDKQASFKVGNQQVTDLGRLIVTDVGDNKVILARSHSVTSNSDYIKKNANAFYKRIEGQNPNTWGSAPTSLDKSVEEVAKMYSTDHFNPHFTPEGETFFGSRMGAVWWTGKEEKYRTPDLIDTGTLDAIFAVIKFSPTELIAGGESNYLAKLDNKNGIHELNKSGLSDGSIVFLKKHLQRGLLVCVSQGKFLSFFRTQNIDDIRWEPIGKIEASFDFWWTGNTFSKIVEVGDDVAVATTPNVLHVYSAKTGTWTKRTLPKNVTHFGVSNGKRLTMRGMPLPKNYYSDDLGVSWHEIGGTSVFDGLPLFSDENTAYMIGPGEGSSLLSRKADRLMVTRDKGATWETVRADILARRDFAISPDGKYLLRWNQYWLDESADGGKTWYTARGSVYPEKKPAQSSAPAGNNK